MEFERGTKKAENPKRGLSTEGSGESAWGRGSAEFPPARPAGRPCEEASHLLEKVLERDNMLQALRRVESNKGAPGIDGMDAKSLRHYLVDHWPRIKEELLRGTYQPSPVRRVEIPKPDGGVRLLGIPTVTDRMIQQAILQVLTPIFDPGFSDYSFGFRPGEAPTRP